MGCSKCDGEGCPRRTTCRRFVGDVGAWQSWFSAPPFCEDECEEYISMLAEHGDTVKREGDDGRS
jgi:hypothetical protein